MSDKKEDRVVKYVGGGRQLVGIPNRDLTLEEYETHRELIEKCPTKIFELPGEEKTPPKKKAKPAESKEE